MTVKSLLTFNRLNRKDSPIVRHGFPKLCLIAIGTLAIATFVVASVNVDSTFTTATGRVTTEIGIHGAQGREVMVQPNGKIVVVGKGTVINSFGDFTAVRYNPDGSLDNSFDGDGRVSVAVGIQDSLALGGLLQPDGKIVVVGEARASNPTSDDFALMRLNSDGSLDSTFGSGGKVLTNFSGASSEYATAVAIQSDGKLVAVGQSGGHFAVARYGSDGLLDPAFGSGGITTTTIGTSGDVARAVAIQTDGKIVVAGDTSVDSFGTTYWIGIARYNTNGSLDTTFDTDGKVLKLIGTFSNCQDVLVQSDGKIVTIGSASVSPGGALVFALARFDSIGAPDPTFGVGGVVTTGINNPGGHQAWGALLQGDGKIVLTGTVDSDIALVRYNTDGALDSSFGIGGKVVTTVAGADVGYDVAIQPDGKLVVCGQAASNAASEVMAEVRYQPNGRLDESFGFKVPGRVTTIVSGGYDVALCVVVQPDGKIVSGGQSGGATRSTFALARHNPDGTLDQGFGVNGTVRTRVGTGDTEGVARSLALQPDGKIVAVGKFYDANNTSQSLFYFLVIRYNPDGSLDTTFDLDGIKFVPAAFEDNQAHAVAIQTDGKILVAGYYDNLAGAQSTYDFALVRLNPDGSMDSSFDGDGVAITNVSGSNATAFAMVLQPDGKIVVGGVGYGESFAGYAMARYNTNGSLDPTFGTGGLFLAPQQGNLSDIRAMSLQPDGKILAAGSTVFVSASDLALIRVNSNGTLDTNFGVGGRVITGIATNTEDTGSAVILQPDGKIIEIGTSVLSNNSNIVLVRFRSDGSRDTSFGNNGIYITDYTSFGNSAESANAAALLAGGKLILAGGVRDNVVLGLGGERIDFLLIKYRLNALTPFDFDGDSRSDVSVFRPPNGTWYISNSSNGAFRAEGFGANGDLIVPGDFDGDGKTDTSVFRPSNGYWYFLNSSNGAFVAEMFGQSGDIPATGDYDGDGKSDMAVYRPSNNYFYLLHSSDHSFHFTKWGQADDLPVMGDYDGDNKTDLAIFRPLSGTFYILISSNGSVIGQQFGANGDKPIAADFDGDGKTDIGVYRLGTWYYLQSSDNAFRAVGWGTSGDIASSGDYDGDGKWDVAVFRPSSGTFYILPSTTGALRAEQFGANGDVPVSSAYVP